MSDSYWRSGQRPLRKAQISWPSLGQIVRQALVALLLVGIWSGLFIGFLRLSSAVPPPRPPTPEPVAAQSTPPATNTIPPPATDTPTPTITPVPSDTPSLTSEEPEPTLANQTNEATEEPATATLDPSPTPTDTPTLEPTVEPEPTLTAPPLEATTEPAPADAEAGQVSFSQDVFPIIERRCIKCHGGERPEGGQRLEEGLSLLTYEDMMAGSWNGTVLEPGDSESYLIRQIVSGKMPKKEPRLLPREIRLITEWIVAGAADN